MKFRKDRNFGSNRIRLSLVNFGLEGSWLGEKLKSEEWWSADAGDADWWCYGVIITSWSYVFGSLNIVSMLNTYGTIISVKSLMSQTKVLGHTCEVVNMNDCKI